MDDPSKSPSYHHAHHDVLDLGWARFGELCKQLTVDIARTFEPEAVVGIAKGGVLPAVVIASGLSRDFFPIKLSSRENEKIVRTEPKVFGSVPQEVRGRRVLLVDDICITMRTLRLARSLLADAGAAEIRCATFAVHGGSARPEWHALETDDLLLFPWDKETLRDGRWALNPEYAEELQSMGILERFLAQGAAR